MPAFIISSIALLVVGNFSFVKFCFLNIKYNQNIIYIKTNVSICYRIYYSIDRRNIKQKNKYIMIN